MNVYCQSTSWYLVLCEDGTELGPFRHRKALDTCARKRALTSLVWWICISG